MKRFTRYIALIAMLALMLCAIFLPAEPALAVDGEPAEQLSSAELQEKLDAANAYLEQINIELMDAGEALNETRYNLEVTNQQIEETTANIEAKKAELAEARRILSSRTRADYKAGPTSFLSVLLESRSFAELISHIYYVDKINEADHAAIMQVEALKAELEEQQAALEQQKAELAELEARQVEQQAALEAKVADQAAYVNSLDSQVQEALAREEEERRRAAEEAARAAAAAAAANNGSFVDANTSNPEIGESPAVIYGEYTGGNLSADTRNAIIAAAYTTIGTPYVYGGSEPGVGIDCSGMTSYAYGTVGISLPHYSQAQMAMCNVVPISQLQPGDLVFWTSPRHVAIYLGNGMVIEAVQPAVKVQAIWGNPVGGGCPV